MASVFRDTALGSLVRLVSGNRLLQYPEERADFKLPDAWLRLLQDDDAPNDLKTVSADEPTSEGLAAASGTQSSDSSDNEEKRNDSIDVERLSKPSSLAPHRTKTKDETAPGSWDRIEAEAAEIERVRSAPIVPRKTRNGDILVDWYTTDDPENPHNWSNLRRALVVLIICVYTFVVYTSSAIYTTSEYGIMEEFGVNGISASLGLSLFVLGYGTGPLIFSPLSELPSIGRNPIYVATMFIFVIVSIPAALVDNFAGLMVLRFLQGFFGSPCLASGGASIGDLYSLMSLPYAMMAWVASAYCGPSIGPLLSGFSVPVMGWRWSLFEILWAAAPIFVVMFLLLPETSGPNILLRRAQRLRKLTGSARFVTEAEVEQRGEKFTAVLLDTLIKPIEITIKDPAILFVQVYTAIIYGIFYSFFEVFPLVFPVYYNMSAGEIGLVFLCILVSCIIGVAAYSAYLALVMNPRIRAAGRFPVYEARLVPALAAAFGPTVGLFVFAWTARPDVHWIVPTIGITIYGATVFVVMQCIFVYVPLSYPRYAASLFAGNDFFRSALAFASVLFARPLFADLGVARGVTLLGGLSTIGIMGIWLLYFFGASLRAMSKFAVTDVE